ncbi:MAG TPA: restriction endonuclease [Bosea sp. (in: a-proteobacteria)]|uniref:restriction endonuclease n=1 Tax=Bosea sp. (in: a-proteobacteria) TaxID=1871050 RepID=UPI002DDD1AC2|nr:restriction endonuclease [Bosea sp. (in: a-proteobacteria)]HEV2556801.1 restriction endonuclease [Bosea sp. (in: a-proteobacteria)]
MRELAWFPAREIEGELMPPVTTRTLGPLHLEDLEPHRFEDLVRQLLYDFRNWGQIEATGRSGGDDGFDARAWEITEAGGTPEIVSDEPEGELVPLPLPARQWLIQCKRERTIGPSQLVKYLASLPADGSLAGLIFVAACDFSKRARDAFRDRVRELGIGEAHLWGKGELEDQLFQPKNDHLLFAYFGISLQVRRRSLRATTRSTVTIKRKVKRLLFPGMEYLVRDVTDVRYPWRDEAKGRDFAYGRWRVIKYAGMQHDGLRFEARRHYAYLSDDGQSWDWSELFNLAAPHQSGDPWAPDREKIQKGRDQAFEEWSALPEANRGYGVIEVVLPFDAILEVDDIGDDWFEQPHVLVDQCDALMGPFRSDFSFWIERYITSAESLAYPAFDARVSKFSTKQP